MKTLKISIAFGLLSFLASCTDDDANGPMLSGIYSETAPVSGRSELNFINENTVIKSEPENSIEDKFTYEINGNIIKLSLIGDDTITQEFEIVIMSDSKFEIENLYGSIGMHPKSYMTYEK